MDFKPVDRADIPEDSWWDKEEERQARRSEVEPSTIHDDDNCIGCTICSEAAPVDYEPEATEQIVWWLIDSDTLQEMLQACYDGKAAGLVYSEYYANENIGHPVDKIVDNKPLTPTSEGI